MKIFALGRILSSFPSTNFSKGESLSLVTCWTVEALPFRKIASILNVSCCSGCWRDWSEDCTSQDSISKPICGDISWNVYCGNGKKKTFYYCWKLQVLLIINLGLLYVRLKPWLGKLISRRKIWINIFSICCHTVTKYSKHRPSGPLLSISRNVRLSVYVSVCSLWGTV